MNLIDIDYDKGIVKSDFFEWQIVFNENNKYLLLQREDKGKFRAAEADVKKKQIWEVSEITYHSPDGDLYVFEEDTGISKL
ncbi:MAG: hypothetical protein GWM98_20550 [Nitrospinaceae bacterium]|nr:hypothetical protein [Nitrospinaceae bacterium]NIR56422.1 hypothetical protein [Nitrospinaceae bacterium]NIS86886.1 hypothetical protein [Nitrospinaceae bacterium]NIT83722.1 hypothetical protein [Nitrospinaceae bacterium]NIU45923.1 hypothetical protein [Nitrospinaceae bacterium]